MCIYRWLTTLNRMEETEKILELENKEFLETISLNGVIKELQEQIDELIENTKNLKTIMALNKKEIDRLDEIFNEFYNILRRGKC